MKIIIIEDEIKLGNFIKQGLEQSGYIAELFQNGTDGINSIVTNNYDVLILDLMLPGQNGFDILKNIKDFGIKINVIVLSAITDTNQVIKALDDGAVDYIKKPFELGELLARIRIIQRKSTSLNNSIIKVDDLELNIINRQVKRSDKIINLTNREFSLLEYMMLNANNVVTKSQISEKVWDSDFDMSSNVIEVSVYQLRKKIDKGFDKQLINTVIGVGYTLKGKLEKSNEY